MHTKDARKSEGHNMPIGTREYWNTGILEHGNIGTWDYFGSNIREYFGEGAPTG